MITVIIVIFDNGTFVTVRTTWYFPKVIEVKEEERDGFYSTGNYKAKGVIEENYVHKDDDTADVHDDILKGKSTEGHDTLKEDENEKRDVCVVVSDVQGRIHEDETIKEAYGRQNDKEIRKEESEGIGWGEDRKEEKVNVEGEVEVFEKEAKNKICENSIHKRSIFI